MSWDYLRSSYDTVAAKYEARFVDELRDKPLDRELLSAFAASVEDPIVEIGCGPGHIGAFVRAARDRSHPAPPDRHDHRVLGVDLSPVMAALASRRLDAALVADMRSLPFATDAWGGIVAFYSLIHLRRDELVAVLADFRRVLRPGGRVLFSAHEGEDELERDAFLDEPVPFAATLFALDELVGASRHAGLEVLLAQRRGPYPSESGTVRLYVEAVKRPKRSKAVER